MLSFISENFNTVHDIDSELVLERTEFSGHTVGSLKKVFNRMTVIAARHLHKPLKNVSLREIIEDAKTSYDQSNVRKMTEATKRRQMEIIEYFESVIKLNKIENFL